MNSTAAASFRAASPPPPASLAAATVSSGRRRLPPALIRWSARAGITATGLCMRSMIRALTPAMSAAASAIRCSTEPSGRVMAAGAASKLKCSSALCGGQSRRRQKALRRCGGPWRRDRSGSRRAQETLHADAKNPAPGHARPPVGWSRAPASGGPRLSRRHGRRAAGCGVRRKGWPAGAGCRLRGRRGSASRGPSAAERRVRRAGRRTSRPWSWPARTLPTTA